jgi:hypothetical protein
MNFTMRTPCDNCPFRSDKIFHLHPERVDEIEEGLDRGTFPCHKTVDYSSLDEDGASECRNTEKEVHCAGALILLEKLERPSQMMRIAERLGMYDRTKLAMNAPVFKTFRAMRRAMENLEKKGSR